MRTRQLNDWILIVAINVGVLATAVWNYRNCGCTPRGGLVSGILSSVVLVAVLLLTIRVRNHRLGLPTPISLLIGAVVCSLLSCCGLWLMLGNEMSENDICLVQ